MKWYHLLILISGFVALGIANHFKFDMSWETTGIEIGCTLGAVAVALVIDSVSERIRSRKEVSENMDIREDELLEKEV